MKPLLKLIPKNLIKRGVVIFWFFLFFCLDLSTVFSQDNIPLQLSCDMGYQIEGDKVTITVSNCNEDTFGNWLYFIKIYKGGEEIDYESFHWSENATLQPQEMKMARYLEAGNYEAKLLECEIESTGEHSCPSDGLITKISFSIEEQDSPTKLECGMPCSKSGGRPCPTGCPCEKSKIKGSRDAWFCGGEEAIEEIARGTTNITCGSGKGVQTALGCIPTDPIDLVKWLFPYLLGFGGLAAFGLIVFSGFQLMTSSGNPQKIQGAKETITSAVTGLIFIILSLFLLRLIGVDILGLPGLE
ncbi:MAG: pilin [Patescibacteria group bacterium]|jgi:hypothetical protein